jgi:hypothetical protein
MDVMEESWPSGVCLQGPASNRPERHWLKTVVVSVEGEGVSMWYVRYGSRRRIQVNHRLGVDTRTTTSKPRAQIVSGQAHRQPAYWMGGVRRRGGASLIRARLWNCGNSNYDVKERGQVNKSKAASTDAWFEDGPTRISVEAAVMAAEQRGRVVPVEAHVNSLGRMST